ncbi:leucine-rich repeat transmembrane neuronal protein 2 [Mobula hypostoma]|uniref:leucine-rich repeat transmembrane neuronal protein 2 n=1 Tax=Mobula hypostoma TaxID=723540 RepID=UPI002FC341C4
MGLHSKWPLGGPTTVALCVMSMLLKMLPASGAACPQKCRCEELLFYCDSQGFQGVPDNVSHGSIGLSLRHNSFFQLQNDQFTSFSQLTWLYLDHNQISVIQEDAFQGLYKLKELILSYNRIVRLANTTFSQLINLQNLDLSFNQITSLQPEQFHSLRKLQTLHLRSNSLRTIPIRVFWDCRSLEFLDISNNRLRSLARNGFAGLIKLKELHLEHNQLTKINFAHFPRLISLQTLFLQWNKISILLCGMEWTWDTLEKLDVTGNEIRTIDPLVFLTMPNLKILLMDSNKLTTLDAQIVNSWKSLTHIGLSGNMWICNKSICALASWLSNFQGRWENSMVCASPEHTQGEDILDAVHGFQICSNLSAATTQITTGYTDPTQQPEATEYITKLTPIDSTTEDTENPTTETTAEDFLEPDNTLFTHRIITGTMALLFSFFLIILVVYISRKCCPPTLRRIRHCSMMQHRRQIRHQARQPMADLSTQVPYNEYEPTHEEGALVIINGYGQCKCQQLPYKECEV